MPTQSRTTLKGYFNTGDRPTESQFADLIDSALHKTEDRATPTDIQDGGDNTKFVTPAGAKAAAIQFAPVKKVNGKSPDTAGNVALVIADIPNLQTQLDAKLNSNGLKTINGQVVTGSGDLLVTPQMISIPSANFTIGTAANNSVFTAANDTFNLLANRTYRFRGRYLVTNAVARNSTSIGFILSGTLAISSIEYTAKSFTGALNTVITSVGLTQINQITPTKVTGAVIAGSVSTIEFEGVLRCTAAGGLRPVIGFDPASGTASTMRLGSFVEFEDIGNNTMVKIGNIN